MTDNPWLQVLLGMANRLRLDQLLVPDRRFRAIDAIPHNPRIYANLSGENQ